MRAGRALVAAILLLAGRKRRRATEAAAEQPDPRTRTLPAARRAELLVAALLLFAGTAGLAFAVLYVLRVGNGTQWLGLAIGLSLLFLAAALVVAGKALVPQEVAVEERAPLVRAHDEQEVVALLREGGEGISRRRLITGAAGAAGVGLCAALIAPAASLGPNVAERIDSTPWHAGRRIVDEEGRPLTADDVPLGTLVSGFPEGAPRKDLASPIVLVRLPPTALHLPQGRDPAQWAPEGIVAYSKICTHAACAVALYRYPSFRPTQPRPALVCPCHYSTFDPARGAQVIFGPAGRPLPQLPLQIDPQTRELRAAGGYSGSVGPAWFDVDRGGT